VDRFPEPLPTTGPIPLLPAPAAPQTVDFHESLARTEAAMAGALLAAAAPQTSKAAAALARETQQRASRRSVASAWLAALLLANAAIFVFKFRVYLRRPDATGLMGHGVNCARAFGQCAMLNTALLLAAACRRSATWLRAAFPALERVVPFDAAMGGHAVAGAALLVSSVGHVLAHVYNFSRYSAAPTPVWEGSVLGQRSGLPPQPRYADVLLSRPGWTGHVMVLLMLLAYPLARLSVRRAHFNRFWWSHQLLLLWTLLLVLHGRTAWLEPSQALSWVGLPFGVYLLERARRSVGREVAVARADCDGGGAVSIELAPPAAFSFVAGQYLKLNVAAIARHEWSAPPRVE